MAKNIVIIGGGIVGLCSAYYLQKEGHQITLIDKSDISAGASYVNAGFLTPSHIVPLAAPGMISKGINGCSIPPVRFISNPALTPSFLNGPGIFTSPPQ